MIVGIFVGGKGTRMGGAVKGLLTAPDTGEPLIVRLARVTQEALPGARIVLLGDADPFASIGFPVLPDEPPGVGPLGGLAALLRAGESEGHGVIALAADLPRVTSALVERLATHAPDAAAVAPRQDGIWNPLFGRYAPSCRARCGELLRQGRRSLKSLLESLGDAAHALPVEQGEWPLLDDWDTPEDVTRG